jgi:hypothetical protein
MCRAVHPTRAAILAVLLLALLLGSPPPLASAAAGPLPAPELPAEIDAYARYEGQRLCSSREQPGVAAFRSLLQDHYGANPRGILRDCSTGGRSEHKEGRAYDWMMDASNPSDRAAVEEVLDWLLATDEHGNPHAMARRLGIMYIIWNRQTWSVWGRDHGWVDYTGASPHTDHVHFSFSWDGAEKRTSFWSGRAVLDNSVPGPPFIDVPRLSYYAAPVWWMLGNDITDGWGTTGEYRPHFSVTRGQMAAFLWRMMGEPTGYPDHGFSDVRSGAYYSDAVRWLAAEGITTGVGSSGRFEPERDVTRGEMATFLWRLVGEPTDQPRHGFPDVSDGRFYDQPVSWMAAHAITDGVGNTGRFEPMAQVTRAQMAAFLHRTASTRDAWASAPELAPTVTFRR